MIALASNRHRYLLGSAAELAVAAAIERPGLRPTLYLQMGWLHDAGLFLCRNK